MTASAGQLRIGRPVGAFGDSDSEIAKHKGKSLAGGVLLLQIWVGPSPFLDFLELDVPVEALGPR